MEEAFCVIQSYRGRPGWLLWRIVVCNGTGCPSQSRKPMSRGVCVELKGVVGWWASGLVGCLEVPALDQAS